MNGSFYLVLFGALIASRILMGGAWKALSDNDKLKVINGFGATKVTCLLPLLGLYGIYWLIKSRFGMRPEVDQALFATVLVVGLTFSMLIVSNKLTAIGLPAFYRRKVAIGYALSIGAILGLLASRSSPHMAEPAEGKPPEALHSPD